MQSASVLLAKLCKTADRSLLRIATSFSRDGKWKKLPFSGIVFLIMGLLWRAGGLTIDLCLLEDPSGHQRRSQGRSEPGKGSLRVLGCN